MEFKRYKLKVDFNVWRKDNKNVEVYCIYDSNGNELFDVVEDDFIKLLDMGCVDSDTRQIHADVTASEIKVMCGLYGIYWTDKHTK